MSSTRPTIEPPKVMPSSSTYILPRDHLAAARLNVQHYLFQLSLGYTLHPSIPTSHTMKIADVATGTGIFLLDLSLQHSDTVTLTGLDISADQFPPASSLPSNLTFRTWDTSSADVPVDLVGQFDVVHVKFVVAVIQGNFDRWISNLTKLLRPGGWLQWVEGDFPGYTEWVRDHPVDAQRFPGLAKIAAIAAKNGERGREATRWILEMREGFERAGLERVEYQRESPPKRLERALSEVALLGIEDSARQMGRMEMLEVTAEAGKDLRNGGLYPGLFPVVAVGRKPE